MTPMKRYGGRAGTALVCVAALAASLLAVPAAGAAVRPTVRPAVKAASAAVNPDALPGSTATRPCGNGITAVAITPARGFNPLTATKKELAVNGLPARPASGGKDLATWIHFVTKHALNRKPTCPTMRSTNLRSTPQAARASSAPAAAVRPNVTYWGETSPNWAGQVAVDTYWNYADGEFTIQTPQAPASSCAYSSQWVGIGQGNSSSLYPLVQAGSEADACDDRSHQSIYLWWEITWPNGGTDQVELGSARAGDKIFVQIYVPNDCGDPVFYIDDETSGYEADFSDSHTSCSDGTADWILERTEEKIAGQWYYPQLANSSVYFDYAWVEGPGVEGGIGDVTHYYDWMYDCSTDAKLASPGTITDGDEFENYWAAYGTQYQADECTSW